MSRIHHLKVEREVFIDIQSGNRKLEVKNGAIQFLIGDDLLLKERINGTLSGSMLGVIITGIEEKEEYAVLNIEIED